MIASAACSRSPTTGNGSQRPVGCESRRCSCCERPRSFAPRIDGVVALHLDQQVLAEGCTRAWSCPVVRPGDVAASGACLGE